jgi:hypothetical protein
LVRRCECDTDMPHEGFLPHTSHTEAIVKQSTPSAVSAGREQHPMRLPIPRTRSYFLERGNASAGRPASYDWPP